MTVMNPYYVRRSTVGNVIDVATWTPRKALTDVLMGIVLFALFGAAACLLWDPRLLSLNVDVADWLEAPNQYRWLLPWAAGLAGLIAYFFLGVSNCGLLIYRSSGYYLRAGPGGLSVNLPKGPSLTSLFLSPDVLQRDLAWSEIRDWHVVTKVPVGSLSRSTHRHEPALNVTTTEGEKLYIPTNYFRESSKIIASRVEEAAQMQLPSPDEPLPA